MSTKSFSRLIEKHTFIKVFDNYECSKQYRHRIFLTRFILIGQCIAIFTFKDDQIKDKLGNCFVYTKNSEVKTLASLLAYLLDLSIRLLGFFYPPTESKFIS